MRTRVSGILVVALAAAACAMALTTASAADDTPWQLAPPVPSPSAATSSMLRDVTVLAPNDVWTVGSWWDTEEHPFAVHWDGMKWTAGVLPKPDPQQSPEIYSLTAVDGTGPADVWAVGSSWPPGPPPLATSPLVLRYDGSAWNQVATPPTAAGGALADVDMRTISDGWAVGRTTDGAGVTRPLTMRWRFKEWVPVAAPKNLAGYLTSVVAVSDDEAWAVGTRLSVGDSPSGFALHWDGVAWTEATLPAVPGDASLESVAAVTSTDVWAAGSTCAGEDPDSCVPLVLHLSEGAWRRVPAVANAARLTEVVAFGPTDVWVVGEAKSLSGTRIEHAERWDGQRFNVDATVVVSPQGQLGTALVLAAAAGDPVSGALWAVGWVDRPVRRPNAIHRP